jgi:excisionase family DNA binding protein
MTDEPELLTTSEVARIFKVARSTVAGWAARGLIEYTRTPTGRLRFYRHLVERLVEPEGRRPNGQ